MDEDDGADRETAESELVRHEGLASPSDRLTPVSHAELTCDDQDVAGLILGDEIERVRRAGVNPEAVRRDLTFAPVVELARLRDLGVDELDGPAVLVGRIGHFGEVLGSQCIHRRDGEPSFGAVRKLGQVLGVLERLLGIETEDLGNCRDLVGDRLRARVLLRVRVAGLHHLIGELVAHRELPRELPDAGDDARLELVTLLDELLDAVLIEIDFFECTLGGILNKPFVLLELT